MLPSIVSVKLEAGALGGLGPRSVPGAPFFPLSCAALLKELTERELFAYKRGAFSGASTEHLRLFRAADGGALFVDENSLVRSEGDAQMAVKEDSEQQQKSADQSEHTEEEIRKRAFEIYLARAGGPGDELDDWLKAEAELTGNTARRKSSAAIYNKCRPTERGTGGRDNGTSGEMESVERTGPTSQRV